jgi:hypothetical protein
MFLSIYSGEDSGRIEILVARFRSSLTFVSIGLNV